jgi:hypothetical protein
MRDTFNLQLFADGGDAGGEAGEGAQAQPEAQETPTAEAEANAQIDHAKQWQDLINGDFRDDYKKSIDNQLNRRFKATEELKGQLESIKKISDFFAQRYGLDANDYDGILGAAQNDDALFAEAAAERGLTTEQYKEVRKLEFENRQLQAEREKAEAEAEAEKIYSEWVRQADALKENFPNFDLRSEMEDPDFVQMLQNGVSVEHAFKVLHMDEIMGGLATYTAQKVASQVTEGIRAKGMRPTENGIGHSSQPVKEQIDVSNLTLEQIKQIEERARHGERIVL